VAMSMEARTFKSVTRKRCGGGADVLEVCGVGRMAEDALPMYGCSQSCLPALSSVRE